MFVLARRVPFGGLWAWPGGLGHPILRLVGFVVALAGLVVLAAAAVVALVIDVVTLPVRLLFF